MHGFIPSPLANCIAGALVLRTVPVSNGMLAYLKIPSWLLGKVEVIHNGLAMEPAPADGGPATNGIPVVLAVGRLHPVKGFETLLHAFKQVLARVPEVECWIVGGAFGDGHYANELRELTRTLDLERHVKFLGYLPNAHDYMRRCSVLAVPSRVETFGMVAVEAMRASKPVVACRTGGLKEVVADGETGMLVEPGDARQMAVALVKILTCRALAEKLGAAGRTRVLEHFTMERMAASFGALYARMLKAPPVRGGVPSTAGSMPRPGLVTKPLARAALAQPESTNP
jgi:glycosyltransferase involved in cell wall biosynthesis